MHTETDAEVGERLVPLLESLNRPGWAFSAGFLWNAKKDSRNPKQQPTKQPARNTTSNIASARSKTTMAKTYEVEEMVGLGPEPAHLKPDPPNGCVDMSI